MKQKLLIIGASGHGKVVADIALKMDRWKDIAFLDDDKNIQSVLNLDVIGTSSDVVNYVDEYDVFVAIGDNNTRKNVYDLLEEKGANIPVLIHPNAVIGNQVEIGKGTVIMAGTVINSGTSIGKGCIVNTASSIDHDNIIGDFVHISPGTHIAGTVTIGESSWLGVGSTVSNNVNLTSKCIVGAGAAVIKDITESGVYVGVPVRRV